MNHEKWEIGALAIARKVESGGRNFDGNENPEIEAEHRGFVRLFQSFLPSPARVLAPGAVDDALLLAEAGYETHALVLGPDNVRWLEERKVKLPNPNLLIVREMDAHDLDYSKGFFDGYFSVQFHEHLIAPWIHLMEVRHCSRDGAFAFVDAAGTPLRCIWHCNLIPEEYVRRQWEDWGFRERWRGISGDTRPQFVFEMLRLGHPDFANSGYLQHVMAMRNGERRRYDYSCRHCRPDGRER